MSWRQQVSKLGALFCPPKPVDDLAEEIRTHLRMEEQDNLEAGMPAEEAYYAALRRFGNVTLAQERSREMWGWHSVEALVQDVRYGLRMLRKSPGFTAVAVLTLSLGIGVNAAIFSVVNGVLLQPLPYPVPKSLVSVQEAGRGIGNPASYPDFFDWQAQNRVFSSMASYRGTAFTLTGAGEPIHIQALIVSAGLFQLLGVKRCWAGLRATGRPARAARGGA
jgi:hypothetical protein